MAPGITAPKLLGSEQNFLATSRAYNGALLEIKNDTAQKLACVFYQEAHGEGIDTPDGKKYVDKLAALAYGRTAQGETTYLLHQAKLLLGKLYKLTGADALAKKRSVN